jgi:hypothetical protein
MPQNKTRLFSRRCGDLRRVAALPVRVSCFLVSIVFPLWRRERDLADAAQKIESVSLSYSKAKVAEGEETTKSEKHVTIQ